jgi:hypothetical protein
MSENFVATLDALYGAPGRLDLLASRRTELVRLYVERFTKLAVAKDFYFVEISVDQTMLMERLHIDGCTVVEDSLKGSHVNDSYRLGIPVVESLLRQASKQRRLATLKTRMDVTATTCFLTFMAATARLTERATGTSANALHFVARSLRRFQFTQIHRSILQLFDTHKVGDPIDHPTKCRRVVYDDCLMPFAKTQALGSCTLRMSPTREAPQ